MKDILDYISTWSVLQWIVLVLIAGFIGQFGKMTAEAVVKKVRQRRAEKTQLPNESGLPSETTTGVAPDSLKQASSSTRPEAAEIPDKKLIKAMAKARKKEAKKNR
jgi:hypothetical protein